MIGGGTGGGIPAGEDYIRERRALVERWDGAGGRLNMGGDPGDITQLRMGEGGVGSDERMCGDLNAVGAR